MAVLVTLCDPGCRITRTENPRVGGSIPPLATIRIVISNQKVASERFGSFSNISAGVQYFGLSVRCSPDQHGSLGTVGTVALRPAAVVNVEVNTKDASRIPVGAAPEFLLS